MNTLNKKIKIMYKITLHLIIISSFILSFSGCHRPITDFEQLNNTPQIFPDYSSLVIPANIAPLNFSISETGTDYLVEISSVNGGKITIRQSSPNIRIPLKKWKNLLNENKGNIMQVDISVKRDKWYKYLPIIDTIAIENITNNLVYRTIGITYTMYNQLGIYQRNLEDFSVSAIYKNTSNNPQPCMNCHSFSNYNPEKMSLHIRKQYAGTVVYDSGEFKKINTKTKYTMSPAVYTAWHPNGNLIAYSVNKLLVNYTSNVNKIVEVWDQSSDIVLYDLKTNTITTTPKICSHGRENLPNWSPDGKWLYFISAPKVNEDLSNLIEVKYDLLRIPFDANNMSWGEVDTVISSAKCGKSITFPVASPDGRYILFCMTDHSYFSIYDKRTDLYLLDLVTNKYQKLDILNSNYADSYHTWSKNGRWIVFTSKRIDGVCSRPFIAYFDANGTFHKPFVLPQKDPLFYKEDTWNFNLPTLVDEKVNISEKELRNFVENDPIQAKFDEKVDPDALSGATWINKNN